MALVGVCTKYYRGMLAGFMMVTCSLFVVMFTSVSGFSGGNDTTQFLLS